MKLLGNLPRGLLFVISAPSGTGKTTLVRMLTAEFSSIRESISFTTRKMRPNEVSGFDYHFISEADFKKKIIAEEFLEYAQIFNHYSGTSKESVETELNKGKHLILVIDTQGAMQLKKKITATYIFISPPNINELTKRLLERKANTPEEISTRISWAEREMQASKFYDYLIINQNLHVAYEILRSIFIAEEHRLKHRQSRC